MPASERDWMRDQPTQRLDSDRSRLGGHGRQPRWDRLALWIIASIAVAVGGVLATVWAYVFAALVVAIIWLVIALLWRWWLFPQLGNPFDR
jgi:Flp pilus assembly protein TadB